MKVLHIEDWFHPEMGYQINYFAKYHSPDIKLYIITSNSLNIWGNPFTEKELAGADKKFETENKVKIIRLKTYLIRNGKQNIWLRNIYKTIKQINPDIIFLHTIETFTALRIILNKKFLKNYKIITDTHILYNQIKNNIKFNFAYWLIKHTVVKKINKYQIPVFFTAEENKKILIEKYGVNPQLIKSCIIGTDTSIFYYDANERIKLRKMFKIFSDTPVIQYVGKINNIKKPHLLLKALKTIDQKIDFKVIVIFIGPKVESYYNQYFKNLDNYNHIEIKILDSIKNCYLYKYYSMADLIVLPKENSLSSLDAQACKLPVIMENDFTNNERLKKGGVVYKSNDINDLALKIIELIQNPEKRQQLGSNGQKYIKENYDYITIIKNAEKELFNLYDEN